MKHFNSLLFVLAIAGFLFSNCAEKKKAETPLPVPAPNTPMVGGDADEHGCKASAGYLWSSLKKECIRSFELPLQLLNADKSSGAGVVFAADKKQAEVFSSMGTVVLSAGADMHYSGNAGGTDYYLEQKNGKWLFGKKGETKPSYAQE